MNRRDRIIRVKNKYKTWKEFVESIRPDAKRADVYVKMHSRGIVVDMNGLGIVPFKKE